MVTIWIEQIIPTSSGCKITGLSESSGIRSVEVRLPEGDLGAEQVCLLRRSMMCNLSEMSDRSRPTFSVITPSFRMLDWLKLCAASVADQHGVTFEHIVQDGGTGAELDEWARTRPSLRCFQEGDQGMYDAINRGIKHATGDIFAYLNCDEQYLPGALCRVQQFFEEHPRVEVLFGDAVLADVDGRALAYRRIVRPTRLHTRLEHLGTLSCATFFRRKVLERGFYFDTRWRSIGDCVWVHTLLTNDVPMACLHEPLAIYTFTGANLSASEQGIREMTEWSCQEEAPPSFLRGPAILFHRIRKMAAGAYRRRNLRYAIYTLDSPTRRVEFNVNGVTFGWPGQTAPPAPGRDR
jgi:hypothetical protein